MSLRSETLLETFFLPHVLRDPLALSPGNEIEECRLARSVLADESVAAAFALLIIF